MNKAKKYLEHNVISLHTHLGGPNSELEYRSNKVSGEVEFNLISAQETLDKLKQIGFEIIALTNHNILSVKEYVHLRDSNKDILLLPGIECDVVMQDGNEEIIHLCIIFDDKLDLNHLNKISDAYQECIDENSENCITIEQLFNIVSETKTIVYPHGTLKKGISYLDSSGDPISNENIYNELCNLESIYPFFIDVKQEFHKYSLTKRIKNFFVSDYKKGLSYSNYLVSIDRENDFTEFPFTYFWGEKDFDSLYIAGLIGNTGRFIQEKDIVEKTPTISKMIIRDTKDNEIIHEINFSNGINTIIGDSGSGKTLLLNYIFRELTGDNIPNLTSANPKEGYEEIYSGFDSSLYDEKNEEIPKGTIKPYVGKNIYRKFILALDDHGKINPETIFDNLNIKANSKDFENLIKKYEKTLNTELERRRSLRKAEKSLNEVVSSFNNTIKSINMNTSSSKFNFESILTNDLVTEVDDLFEEIKGRSTDYVAYSKTIEYAKEILRKYNLNEDIDKLTDSDTHLFESVKQFNKLDIQKLKDLVKKKTMVEVLNSALRSVDENNGEKIRKRNDSIDVNRTSVSTIVDNIETIYSNKRSEILGLEFPVNDFLSSVKLEENIKDVKIVTSLKSSIGNPGFIESVCSSIRGRGKVSSTLVKDYIVTESEDINSLINDHLEIEHLTVALSSNYKDYLDVDIRVMGFEEQDVALSEMSAGMLSKFYIRTLIDNEIKKMSNDSIIFFDEPDSNLSKSFIFSELVKKFKHMRKYNQIFFTTHEPLLIVNADSNNLICCKNESMLMEGVPSFVFESGPLPQNAFFEDNQIESIDDIISLFANMIDGDKDAIKVRNKLYLGGSHYE